MGTERLDGDELISMAKDLGKRHGMQACLVMFVDENGEYQYGTWGKNKKKCKAFGSWVAEMVTSGFSLVPFQTIFGLHHKGKPTPLTDEQMKSLKNPDRLRRNGWL